MRIVGIAVVGAFCLLAPIVAQAVPHVYQFEGTIITEIFGTQPPITGNHVGQTITGTITFDPTGQPGAYDEAIPAGGTQTYHRRGGATATTSTVSFTGTGTLGSSFVSIVVHFEDGQSLSPSGAFPGLASRDFTYVGNNVGGFTDILYFQDQAEGTQGGQSIGGQITFNTWVRPFSGPLPTSVLNSSTYGEPLSLTGVTDYVGNLAITYPNAFGGDYFAGAQITNVVAVPEPTTWLAISMGLCLLPLALRRRGSVSRLTP